MAFPRTHDLEFLAARLRERHIELPRELEHAQWLTPWAADLRYDEPAPLDRDGALTAAQGAVRWAATYLGR